MNNILDKADRRDGITVPDGYFEEFARKMEASLPEMEWERPAARVIPRSLWQRVRPYVYLAAMFLGVWTMMNVFDFVRSSAGLGVENSVVLAEALGNDHFMNYYFMGEGDIDEYSIMEDLYDDGFTPAELADFPSDSESYTIDI